jgi:hypothetical protein
VIEIFGYMSASKYEYAPIVRDRDNDDDNDVVNNNKDAYFKHHH